MSNAYRTAREYEIVTPLNEAARLNGKADLSDFADGADVLAGRFTIQQMLGENSIFRRFLARDAELNCPVVLDVLTESAAAQPELLELFHLEAQTAATLSHKNIPAAQAAEHRDGLHFRISEYADGQSLRDLLNRTGWLSVQRAVTIAGQIAQALDYAHRQSALHLSLQPESILLDGEGKVLVCDFGLEMTHSLAWAHEMRKQSSRPAYRCPDQSVVSEAGDWYALGVLLYEMLTDRVPFDSEDAEYIRRKHQLTRPFSPHVILPEVPEAVARLVMELLDKDPGERLRRAADFQERMKQVSSAATVRSGLRAAPAVIQEASPEPVRPQVKAPVPTIVTPLRPAHTQPLEEADPPEPHREFKCEVLPIAADADNGAAVRAETQINPIAAEPLNDAARQFGAVSEPEPVTLTQALRERFPEILMLMATALVVVLLITLPRSGDVFRSVRGVLYEWLMKIR